MENVLRRARHLAEDYYGKLLPDSAVFWAEKAVLLSGGEIDDIVLYCQSLYLSGQYRRAVAYLENSGLLSRSSALRYLAGKCLAACKSWNEVITLLASETADDGDLSSNEAAVTGLAEEDSVSDLISRRLGDVNGAPTRVLLGKAYDATGNAPEAVLCYKEALTEDPYCEETIERLYSTYALQANEEQAQMSALSFSGDTSVEEELVTKFLYQSKLHHNYPLKKTHNLPHTLHQSLSDSIDIRSHSASLLLESMNVEKCMELTRAILRQDPYHTPTLLVHIACFVIKRSSKDLYCLGQDLVKHFPESPLAWYAVGCYYYSLSKHPQVRRYLSKAINLDAHFAHAHLVFGLSFASEGEHDQAIAAFSHAARFMKSYYLPLMYLGKEYSVTGNLPIAISFIKSALSLAPDNPSLCQEVGLLLAANKSYAKAETYFTRSVALLQKLDPHVTLPVWEPVYNNLSHVLRKQGKYGEALEAHKKALQLIPNEPDTLTGMAFVYLLLEDYNNVVHYCNQSLRIRREDQFTIEVLQNAVNELASVPLSVLPVDDQLVYGEVVMQTD